MPRLRKIDRSRRLELKLPESIYRKVHDQLYSEVENGVPFGAMSALGTELFSNWLKARGVEV